MFADSGIAVPYFNCVNCGFIFTTYMDNWSAQDFKERIYNSEYHLADGIIPGEEAGRDDRRKTISYRNGVNIGNLFNGAQQEVKILDYGSGGNPGDTGLALIDLGFDLDSYEPHFVDSESSLNHDKYNLIIAIEVFEHCNDLNALGNQMRELLAPNGLIWIQTLLHPYPSPPNVLSSWYIAPRNGHISIFTLMSLTILFRKFGINIIQNAFGIFGFKNLPTYKNQIFV